MIQKNAGKILVDIEFTGIEVEREPLKAKERRKKNLDDNHYKHSKKVIDYLRRYILQKTNGNIKIPMAI